MSLEIRLESMPVRRERNLQQAPATAEKPLEALRPFGVHLDACLPGGRRGPEGEARPFSNSEDLLHLGRSEDFSLKIEREGRGLRLQAVVSGFCWVL